MSEKQDQVTQDNQNTSPDATAIVESESGARNPTGAVPKKILFYVPLAWTLFQLWYASPLPFLFNFFVLNSTEARAIHLAFAIFLAFTAFPTLKSSPTAWGTSLPLHMISRAAS